MNKCKNNCCLIAWYPLVDQVINVEEYIGFYKDDYHFNKEQEDVEWFNYCPRCGCEIKQVLKDIGNNDQKGNNQCQI